MRFVLFGFGTIVLLAATACGGGSKSASQPAIDQAPCANDATRQAVLHAPTATAGPSPTAAVGAARPTFPPLIPDSETQCRIRKALLTIDDMPAGWRPSEFIRSDNLMDRLFDGQQGECNIQMGYLDGGIIAEFETGAAYGSPATTPTLVLADETLLVFNPGRAAGYFALLRTNCTKSGVGTERDAPVDALATKADETLGVTSRSSPETDVYVRRGDVLMEIKLRSGGAPIPFDEVSDIVRRADVKFVASLARLQARAGTNLTVTP